MMDMATARFTEAQVAWFSRNPGYRCVGRPRAGVSFTKCGTLYADGRFEPLAPMKVIRLEPGCIGVGIEEPPDAE